MHALLTDPGRPKILRSSILVASSLLVGACASAPPAAPAAEGEVVATQSKLCAQEPITGSHLRRCGTTNVETISRDDLELIRSRTNSMPMEPGTTRGR
jgi:hypothetical protein